MKQMFIALSITYLQHFDFQVRCPNHYRHHCPHYPHFHVLAAPDSPVQLLHSHEFQGGVSSPSDEASSETVKMKSSCR